MAKKTSFPAVSAKIPQELRPLLQSIVENLEISEGVRGDPLDRKVTHRDLVDFGLAKAKVAGNTKAGLVAPTVDDLTKNFTAPPAPEGLVATPGSFGLINLSWALPTYKNHGCTNIYRSTENNQSTARIVAKSLGGQSADFIPPFDDHSEFFYWISFTTTAGVEGSFNASSGVLATRNDDTTQILSALVKKISFEHLTEQLGKRVVAPTIKEIPGPVAGTGAFVELVSQVVTVDSPGILEVIANTKIGGPDATPHDVRLLLNGVSVSSDFTVNVNYSPKMAFAKSVPAGTYMLSIEWQCPDVTANISDISIFTKIHI
jgi:hypothetical protein